MKEASDLLCPVDYKISSLANIKPKHSLIIVAHGPAREQVRVEADIDMVNDDSAHEFKGVDWQIGTTHYYQESSRKTRVTITTLGFELYVSTCKLKF